MAKIYLDTGALVKLYVVEQGSDFVQRQAAKATVIPINALQETELRNAILAAAGRGAIGRDAAQKTLSHFNDDLSGGQFARHLPDWEQLWERATQLAQQHTARLLCRTLDVLHVAAAEQCSADHIVTGDQRQQKLAKAVGLSVIRMPR